MRHYKAGLSYTPPFLIGVVMNTYMKLLYLLMLDITLTRHSKLYLALEWWKGDDCGWRDKEEKMLKLLGWANHRKNDGNE